MASSPLLFSLPTDVRARILREAGLVRKCPIGFSQERIRLLRVREGLFGYRGNIGCYAFNNDRGNKAYYDSSDAGCCDTNDSNDGSNSSDWPARPFPLRLSETLSDRVVPLPCVHGPLPIDLLLVCHQVHNEAANILYSENFFTLTAATEALSDVLSI